MKRWNVPIISTDKFHYHSGENLFTQEISSLGKGFHFGQLYADAIDEGFELVSHRTGQKITFFINKIDVDDNEIIGWHLKPTCECVRKYPSVSKIRILIIND